MDDDVYVDAGAVLAMVRLMIRDRDVEMLGGSWRLDGKWCDVAQHINFGRIDGRTTVYKPSLTRRILTSSFSTSLLRISRMR